MAIVKLIRDKTTIILGMIMQNTIKLMTFAAVVAGLTGCGGGGGSDDKYYSNDALSAREVAQVAAAIQAAKTTFEVVVDDGLSTLDTTIAEGDANKTLACRTGSYRVTPNPKTSAKFDGLLANNACTTSTSKWDGAIELECLDAKCEKSISTATGALWSDRIRGVDLTVNGEMLSDALRDGFKGNASINILGKKTVFDFADVGLIQDYYNHGVTDGFGQLRILNGENNRCINGSYGYDVTSNLVAEAGSTRVIGGEMKIVDGKNRSQGSVRFERDGGISVQTRSGHTEFISAAQFESYCGLSEAYRFSTH